jgi:hypothetical protein
MHIDENTTHEDREVFRDALLSMVGVMEAAYHDEKPYLMVIIYNPGLVESIEFVDVAKLRE